MACGKPIVAYANDGYKAVLKGKGARFLAEPKNIIELYEKLEKLIVDDKLRYEMTRWGLEEVKKYSWNHITKEIIQIYKKAIKDNKIDERLKKRQEKGKYFDMMFRDLFPKLYEKNKTRK
jgi:glycosyltransferase involved in cell wall biosynthesis